MRFLLFSLFCLFTKLFALSDAEIFLSEGSGHNNFMLYEDAVKLLTNAIKCDPSCEEAYQERALSYFELNKLDLALADYKQAKALKTDQNKSYTNSYYSTPFSEANAYYSLDFAKGLLNGTFLGGKEGTIEFISSIRGSFNFLWALACSPINVSKELIDTLHEIGTLLASGQVAYFLEESLPELYECSRYWDYWSDYTKGQKLGFIIGKYSISAFCYITSVKGGSYFYNRLKRANTMAILERYSLTKSSLILEESAKYAAKNSSILKKAAKGSIVAHNPNVLPHVFTKKHRWDKFIKLTGNQQKDFESLVAFLEKEKILQCPYEIDFSFQAVVTYKYTKKIGHDTVVALFEINKNNVPFLRNAWVEIGVLYK